MTASSDGFNSFSRAANAGVRSCTRIRPSGRIKSSVESDPAGGRGVRRRFGWFGRDVDMAQQLTESG